MNCKADALLTPDQRLATAGRIAELRKARAENRRLRRNAVLRANRIAPNIGNAKDLLRILHGIFPVSRSAALQIV